MEVRTITDGLFFNTIKISTWGTDGEQGSGTGFIFNLEREGQFFPLLVTNKHVINGTVRAAIRLHQSNDNQPRLGDSIEVTFSAPQWPAMWTGHPDPNIDISVAELGSTFNRLEQEGKRVFYKAITQQQIPSAEQIRSLDALEEVIFAGYPNGVWDSHNALPVLRRGTTATPLSVDFEGTPRFLIDASVFGGSSGSPVFIANTGNHSNKEGHIILGSRLLFLGVIAAVFFRKGLNEIISVPIPTTSKPMAVQQEMIDLGIVFKSSTVSETAEHWYNTRVKPFI